MSDFGAKVAAVAQEEDPARKNALVAALVSEAFSERGFEPVVVGGSAVEAYTEGAYVSGDVDICFAGVRAPSLAEKVAVMKRFAQPVSGGLRQWNVGGVLVDVMGTIETSAHTPFQIIGPIKLIQIEDLIAERILIATSTGLRPEAAKVAKLLLKLAQDGQIEVVWSELQRVAEGPDYRVGEWLRKFQLELRDQAKAKPRLRP